MSSASVSVQFWPVANAYAQVVLGVATVPAVLVAASIVAPIVSGFTMVPGVALTTT